jgi:peptidyl-prolyl cis-trans isomerase SurA
VRSLAALSVVSAVLLTGCGSVPDLNPGVAARVGDETVSTDRVRTVADDYCAAAVPQLQQQGQVFPRHYLNGQVASALALRSAADQVLASYDVQPDPSYDKAVANAESQLGDLSATQRDALIEVQGVQLYVKAVELAVGRSDLGSSASDDDAEAAGAKVFESWLDDHHVAIDPRYGVTIDKGKSGIADTGVSFAVSDTAKQADADNPDATYAATLPESQRCG